MAQQLIYHGSYVAITRPEIRITKYNKDFYFGFYCTEYREQAVRWATRFTGRGIVSTYEYTPNIMLKELIFPELSEEWLDFIVACRAGTPHTYDIVEGPMADDTIFNYVQAFIDGEISREAFWELAKFKHPTHQISFHTEQALQTLTYVSSDEVSYD